MPGAVPVLTWHSLDDSGSVISTRPETFRAQLRVLRESGYAGITAAELVAAWEGRACLPDRPAVLTFDDAFRNVLEVAVPALGEAGFRATVFAVAATTATNEWPGQPDGIPRLPVLGAAGLRELGEHGHEIGAHGLTHRRLDLLDGPDAEAELAAARARLEEAVGREVQSLAYPYGRTSPALSARAAGHYRAAFTDELRLARPRDDRHALGRLDMYYFREPARLRLLGTRRGAAWTFLRRLARRLRARI